MNPDTVRPDTPPARAALVTAEIMNLGAVSKELGEFQILRIVRSDGSVSVKVLEPFTWMWVAIKLCEGVLQAIGARIFASIFENGDKSLDILLEEAIKAIRAIIRAAIAENEARKIGDEVAHLNWAYRDYLTVPTPSKLETLKFATGSTMEGATSLGMLTAGHLTVIGSLELALYQEAFKVSNKPGDKELIVKLTENLLPRIPRLVQKFVDYETSRFSDIRVTGTDRSDPPVSGRERVKVPMYYYLYDNQYSFGSPDRGLVEKTRADTIALYLKRQHDEVTGSIEAVGEKWKAIGAMYRG